jgi:two-component system LytT family response regulator
VEVTANGSDAYAAEHPPRTLRVLIADDEPPARQQLLDLLGEVSWVRCVGAAADGAAAVADVERLRPDVLFLDIEMPVLSGLAVLERVQHRPAVVFTTAYDRYAVAAFELAALDYLLKPFGRERLRAALDRARLAVAERSALSILERARDAAPRSTPPKRFFVRDSGRIVPIAVRDIQRVEARDDYVDVVAGGRSYLVHLPLAEFERRLDPSRFARIHRSRIVNLDHVVGFTPYDASRLQVEMKDGTRLVASRQRSRALRERSL